MDPLFLPPKPRALTPPQAATLRQLPPPRTAPGIPPRDWQSHIGNYGVTNMLNALNAPPPIKAEAEAETETLAAAQTTLAKSRRIASSLEGSSGLPPMKYWFAKLYEMITEAEIEHRGHLRYPAFMLRFIPVFYDLYEINLERYQAGARPPPKLHRPTDGDFEVDGTDDIKAFAAWFGLSEGQAAGPVASHWSRYFVASEYGDKVQTGETDLWDRLWHNYAYVFGDYMNAATVSILEGVSAHVQGDMGIALASAYTGYHAKYLGSGPFDKYREDFFERNRPIFNEVRVKLVTHLFHKLGDALAGLFAENLLDLGDIFGIGGPRVDQIYTWRAQAWTDAEKQIEQGPQSMSREKTSMPASRLYLY